MWCVIWWYSYECNGGWDMGTMMSLSLSSILLSILGEVFPKCQLKWAVTSCLHCCGHLICEVRCSTGPVPSQLLKTHSAIKCYIGSLQKKTGHLEQKQLFFWGGEQPCVCVCDTHSRHLVVQKTASQCKEKEIWNNQWCVFLALFCGLVSVFISLYGRCCGHTVYTVAGLMNILHILSCLYSRGSRPSTNSISSLYLLSLNLYRDTVRTACQHSRTVCGLRNQL